MLRAPETCRGREDKEKERTGNTLKRNEERIRNAREIHKGTLGTEKRTNEKLYEDQIFLNFGEKGFDTESNSTLGEVENITLLPKGLLIAIEQ